MKLKFSTLAIAAAGLIASTSASALIVGGVDFGNFPIHIDTTTLAETFVNGNGQTLQAFGQVNTINGMSANGGLGNDYTSTLGDNDRLYFTLTYTSQNFGAGSVEFAGGIVNIYKGIAPNLLTIPSAAGFAAIQLLTPWLQLKGHANIGPGATTSELSAIGTLVGTGNLAFNGSGLLDVNPGGAFPGTLLVGIPAVEAALNGNTILDAIGGKADILVTTSGANTVLNPFDGAPMLARCRTGGALVGDWCFQGSADLRGSLIPEPATLALVGLGLLGAGVARRRKDIVESVA